MMRRDEFMQRLAEATRPRSAQAGATVLIKMLPFLNDLDDDLFTEGALVFLASRLPRSPTLPQLRAGFEAFSHSSLPPPPPPQSEQERDRQAWANRQIELRHDWDDPSGILRRVHDCGGNILMLRLLGKLVRMWAPQHLGYIPPHILAAIDIDAEVAPQDRHLRFAADASPEGTRSVAEQLNALGQVAVTRPFHLTPEQLDQINPLPNGRKRT